MFNLAQILQLRNAYKAIVALIYVNYILSVSGSGVGLGTGAGVATGVTGGISEVEEGPAFTVSSAMSPDTALESAVATLVSLEAAFTELATLV